MTPGEKGNPFRFVSHLQSMCTKVHCCKFMQIVTECMSPICNARRSEHKIESREKRESKTEIKLQQTEFLNYVFSAQFFMRQRVGKTCSDEGTGALGSSKV